MQNKVFRILVAAGGTGGHLFPAIAVVEQLEKLKENNFKAVFIGTNYRIESKVVPSLGYEYYSMPITGLTKLLSLNTLLLPFKILKSIAINRKIIRDLKPNAVLCTGAYISYPAGIAASKENIPLILMESNVNPGKTIKQLSDKASLIITAFEETKTYFNLSIHNKIKVVGNPIRNDILQNVEKEKVIKKFGLKHNKKTVLIFGGSLGAYSINKAVEKSLDYFIHNDIQLIWQIGNNFKPQTEVPDNIKIIEFIDDMASAYASADLVVSRSGATSVAEICVVAKPSILIPLETASNNEQMENAKIMQKYGASIIIRNNEIEDKLLNLIKNLINDKEKLNKMSEKSKELAKPNSAKNVAKILIDLFSNNS